MSTSSRAPMAALTARPPSTSGSRSEAPSPTSTAAQSREFTSASSVRPSANPRVAPKHGPTPRAASLPTTSRPRRSSSRSTTRMGRSHPATTARAAERAASLPTGPTQPTSIWPARPRTSPFPCPPDSQSAAPSGPLKATRCPGSPLGCGVIRVGAAPAPAPPPRPTAHIGRRD